MPLDVLERYWTLEHCDYEPSAVSKYLLVFYFAHYAIALIIFVLGLANRELYLLLLSTGITANYWLNLLLRWALMAPVPTASCGSGAVFCIDRTSPYNACGLGPYPVVPPAGATCGGGTLPDCAACVPCGMPALEPQLTAFTVVSIGIFAFQWDTPRLQRYQLALLFVFYALVMYTHVFFGFSDAGQVLAGAAIGASAALLWQVAVYELAYPNFDRVLRWPLVRYFGYHDTYCRDKPKKV